MKLYVVFQWDLIHETVNAVNRALQKCKLCNVVQELLYAWKLPWGPWLNLGFHAKVKYAARAFAHVLGNTCDNFTLWLGSKVRSLASTAIISRPNYRGHEQMCVCALRLTKNSRIGPTLQMSGIQRAPGKQQYALCVSVSICVFVCVQWLFYSSEVKSHAPA